MGYETLEMKLFSILTFNLVNKSFSEECKDLYPSCSNMKNLCGREDFAGVDHHCPKTCGRCNKKSKNNEGRTTKALDQSKLVVKRLECKEPEWCNQFMCSSDRYRSSCPISCGSPKCLIDEEHLDTSAKLEKCEDDTKACSILKGLCDDPIHGAETRKNCSFTCGVCKPANEVTICEDINPECAGVEYMCKTQDPTIKANLARECAKTCGFCPDNTPSPAPQIQCMYTYVYLSFWITVLIYHQS